ncbi:alpha-1,2-mannosyltransferase (Kre5) [Pichia californica]|uniref:Alpha-1,2-mannosyltransferase (Kre5) n=1 Tax=Pichia californica TaxID=460514 RepID=A0A9P7BGT5_9ASCO|nr:alpha-1,2-mannosyltransferase (Kre5) [[Candida] californica]KAG0688668.1 alpha-1,2-mannosyltransferase (Kre5) [[Candida] californica]
MFKQKNWKPVNQNSFIYRIKSKFRIFLNFNITIISNKFNIKLWKLIFLILTISLLIQSYLLQNKRIKPLNINYSILNNSKNFKNFDEKFQIGNKFFNQCPISERSFKSKIDDVFQYGCRDPIIESEKPRANAAFVVLARNSEIDGVILSMRSLERRFNQWFNYPWIFLNDEEFTDEFEIRVKEVASGDIQFGLIPSDKWKFKNQISKNDNKYKNKKSKKSLNKLNKKDKEKFQQQQQQQQQQSENNYDSIFFNEAVESQGDRGIMYGNMPSYHSMCRFYSGYFFEHPLVQKLNWYWRVEPEVDFYCDLTYDPFIEMEKHGKKYGYTIAIKELVDTVPNLFRYTQKFINENKINLPDTWNLFSNNHKFFKGGNEDNYKDVKNLNDFFNKLKKNTIYNYSKLHFIKKSDNNYSKNEILFLKSITDHSKINGLNNVVDEKYNNEEYNLCHFWSNFEIASNEVFNSPEYKLYYDFLEESNGFFTERWGDAPIHSLAIGMFLDLSEIHYFRDIGYKHSTLGHCPYNSPNQLPYKSSPNFKHQVLPKDEILYADYDPPVTNPNLVENLGPSGCRCRCPSDHKEIENSGGSCSPLWMKLTNDEFIKGSQDNDFIGGLGIFKLLDLDKIESTALVWFSESVMSGKDLKDWDFTEKQRDVLSVMYL